jgi:phage terminase large subunit-like protein
MIARSLTRTQRNNTEPMIRTVSDERAHEAGCWFDPVGADHVCNFFEHYLSHTMGEHAGKPFTLLPWQRDDVLRPLFGWKRPDGRRRFAKGDIFIAKKQGKSTIAAGLANYFLVTSGARGEVYGVAHTRDQAGIIYREAAAMARTSPALQDRLKPIDSQKRVVFHAQGSFYAALAGEACSRGVEGINPNLVLFDEIHVQRSRELYDGIAYASAARQGSLMLSVSTVGVADQTTIWWEQYQYAKGLLDGTLIDLHRFAYVAQADEDCINDWELCGKLEQWKKAMPSLGHTVMEDKIQQAYDEATNSPAKQNAFKRYLLNLPTAQVEKVVPIEEWKACATTRPDLSTRRCFGGLDMASSEDLSAFVLYFDATEDEPAYVIGWYWCPEEKVAEREKKQLAHYRQWVSDGWLSETGGNRIDHYEIEKVIRQACEDFNVQQIGFDPWNADAVVNPLLADGFPIVSVSQGMQQMTAGTQGILDDIAARRVYHDGNEVLTWCLANCAADQRDDGIKFSKKKSADKIDGAVSLAMAKGRALANAAESQSSYYEENELEFG